MKTRIHSTLVTIHILLVSAALLHAQGPLTGEKAIEHLKRTGQYESLSAAISGARYGVKTSSSD